MPYLHEPALHDDPNTVRSIGDVSRRYDLVLSSRANTFARLELVGVDAIAERYACGQMKYEIAVEMAVPFIHFSAWFDSKFSDEEAERLDRLQAEAFAARSMAILDDVKNLKLPMTQFNIVKELSMRLKEFAGRLNRDRWDNKPTNTAPATGSIVFNIHHDVPGLEHVTGKVLDSSDSRVAGSKLIDAVAGDAKNV